MFPESDMFFMKMRHEELTKIVKKIKIIKLKIKSDKKMIANS